MAGARHYARFDSWLANAAGELEQELEKLMKGKENE